MTIYQRWKQTAVHNKALVWTGLLVAFGTVFYAFAAACQVSIMKQSSIDSAAQVERLTGATNAAIKTAVDSNSKAISDTMAKNLDELKTVLEQNRAALKASERQSKAALDASIDSARNEYRPWVVFTPGLSFDPTDWTYDTPPSNNEAVTVMQPGRTTRGIVTINNIGRSPARNVSAHLRLVYVEAPTPDKIMEYGERAFQAAAVSDFPRAKLTIAPQDPKTAFSNAFPPLSPVLVDRITKGIGAFILAGPINYIDADGKPHVTEVCAFFTGPSMVNFMTCGVRFDMN